MATTQTTASSTPKKSAKRAPAASKGKKKAQHTVPEQVYLAGLGLYNLSKERSENLLEDLVKRGEKEEKVLTKRWEDTRQSLEDRYNEFVDEVKDRFNLGEKPNGAAKSVH